MGAGAVSLATSYAVGDVLGIKHSLHRHWRDATAFHGCFVAMVAVAAIIVLIPGAPLGVVTTGVQILAGVLLPSATVFLLLLCNDKDVLGPWTNAPWLNVVTASVVAVLVALSGLLTWSTLFGDISTRAAAGVVTASLVAAIAMLIVLRAPGRRGRALAPQPPPLERARWSMPPVESLDPPAPSRARTIGLTVLRAYLAVAGVLVIVKLVRAILPP